MLFSIITALFSKINLSTFIDAHFKYKSQIRNDIYDKRYNLYFEFNEKAISPLYNNSRLVFDDKYIAILHLYSPQFQALASCEVLTDFEKFFQFVIGEYTKYTQYESSVFPDPIPIELDNGEEDWAYDPLEMERFDNNKRIYQIDHTPTAEQLNSYISELYSSMRKDLGSNIK
ncbi:hypothetical protein [Agathobaculum hominis]